MPLRPDDPPKLRSRQCETPRYGGRSDSLGHLWPGAALRLRLSVEYDVAFSPAASLPSVLLADITHKKTERDACVDDTAGDRIRTDDVQLGKLTFYH